MTGIIIGVGVLMVVMMIFVMGAGRASASLGEFRTGLEYDGTKGGSRYYLSYKDIFADRGNVLTINQLWQVAREAGIYPSKRRLKVVLRSAMQRGHGPKKCRNAEGKFALKLAA